MPRTPGLTEMLARHSGQRLGAAVRVDPSVFRKQEGPADVSPLVRNIYPPWVFKLPTSQDFNDNHFDVALAAVIGTTVTLAEFTLPPTFVGYVQIMGIYILSPLATQNVTFKLLVNGGPIQGWDNIKFPPGSANFVIQNFADLQVRIPDSGHVQLVAVNGSADAWTVGGKIAGWYHQLAEEQRIYGAL
jgi:hypothetical protein